MGKSGVRPKDIASSVRQQMPGAIITSKAVQNALSKVRKEELAGRAPIKALIETLSSDDFSSNVRLEGTRVVSVFFAHTRSLELCQRCNIAFGIDCTYKTNKVGMPLLNIVGITATFQTFNAAFAFMSSEDENSYIWAMEQFRQHAMPTGLATDRELALMNAIAKVFPSTKLVLCAWHIDKNILANCKKFFNDDDEFGAFMKSWAEVVKTK